MPEDAIWTSALATTTFLEHRRVGVRDRRGGLTTALHAAGYTLTDRDPDFVVLSEARTYSASSGSRPRSG